MTGSARVIYSFSDNTQYVNAADGSVGGCVAITKSGLPNVPAYCATFTDFLRIFNDSEDLAISDHISTSEVAAFFDESSGLYVTRAANNPTYAGVEIAYETSGMANRSLTVAYTDYTKYSFEGQDDFCLALFAQYPSDIFNRYGVKIYNYRADEFLSPDDIDTTDSSLTTTQSWVDGEEVVLRLISTDVTDALPAGLIANTRYYVKSLGNNKIGLASSYSNLVNNVLLTITSTGSGTFLLRTSKARVQNVDCFLIEVYKDNVLTDYSYECSLKEEAVDNMGNSLYIESVLNNSVLNYAGVTWAEGYPVYPKAQVMDILPLTMGGNGNDVSTNDLISAANAMRSEKKYGNIRCFFDAGFAIPEFQQALDSICSTVRVGSFWIGCVPASAEKAADPVEAVLQYRQFQLGIDSSYGAIYSPHAKVPHKSISGYSVEISPSGKVAGRICRLIQEQQFPIPAGKVNGVLTGFSNLIIEYENEYENSNAGRLYDDQINPIIYEVNTGALIWGQKTLQTWSSVMDRLASRIIVSAIAYNLKLAYEAFLFRYNTAEYRKTVEETTKSYLATVRAAGGILSFQVTCDETNNPPAIRRQNLLYVTISIVIPTVVEVIKFTLRVDPEEGTVTIENA